MAAEVQFDIRLEVNAVVISTKASKAGAEFEAASVDATTFGGSGWEAVLGGLKKGTLSLDLFNDYADNDLDETLWPLLGTVITAKIRKTSAAVSPTNPEYSGLVMVGKVVPFDAGVGDISKQSLSWPTSGAWARAVA